MMRAQHQCWCLLLLLLLLLLGAAKLKRRAASATWHTNQVTCIRHTAVTRDMLYDMLIT
jgi:hypothetical protein